MAGCLRRVVGIAALLVMMGMVVPRVCGVTLEQLVEQGYSEGHDRAWLIKEATPPRHPPFHRYQNRGLGVYIALSLHAKKELKGYGLTETEISELGTVMPLLNRYTLTEFILSIDYRMDTASRESALRELWEVVGKDSKYTDLHMVDKLNKAIDAGVFGDGEQTNNLFTKIMREVKSNRPLQFAPLKLFFQDGKVNLGKLNVQENTEEDQSTNMEAFHSGGNELPTQYNAEDQNTTVNTFHSGGNELHIKEDAKNQSMIMETTHSDGNESPTQENDEEDNGTTVNTFHIGENALHIKEDAENQSMTVETTHSEGIELYIQENTTEAQNTTAETSQSKGSNTTEEDNTRYSHLSYDFMYLYSKVLAEASVWRNESHVVTTSMGFYKKICYLVLILEQMSDRSLKDENKAWNESLEEIEMCDEDVSDAKCTVLYIIQLMTKFMGSWAERYARLFLNTESSNVEVFNHIVFPKIEELVNGLKPTLTRLFEAVSLRDAILAQLTPVPRSEDQVSNVIGMMAEVVAQTELLRDQIMKIITEHENEVNELVSAFEGSRKNVIIRQIPREYKESSPFPILAYYWDMAALQYAVDFLEDKVNLVNSKFQQYDGVSADVATDQEALIALDTLIQEVKNPIREEVYGNKLKSGILQAITGVSSVATLLNEAGVEVEDRESNLSQGSKLLAVIGSLIPGNYNQLMTMVDLIVRYFEFFTSNVNFLHTKLPLENEVHVGNLSDGGSSSEHCDSSSGCKDETHTLLSIMSLTLEDKKAQYMLRWILEDEDNETLWQALENTDDLLEDLENMDLSCTEGIHCRKLIYSAIMQTALILNDPTLLTRWEKTRDNPFKGKSFSEIFTVAEAIFRHTPKPPNNDSSFKKAKRASLRGIAIAVLQTKYRLNA